MIQLWKIEIENEALQNWNRFEIEFDNTALKNWKLQLKLELKICKIKNAYGDDAKDEWYDDDYLYWLKGHDDLII